MTSGLRERRKQETRQAISDIATRLFVAHGFNEVTISQVADAAGVAKMTVTNYFPRKEDLVFDRAETVIGHLAEVVAAQEEAGESMLAAIRRDYAAAVARADVTLGLSSPAFARMIAGSPVLTTRELEMLLLRERALGDAIAAETGTDGPQQRLAAALLASVHRVLYAEARQRSLAGQPRPEICAVLAGAASQAFGLLEPGPGKQLPPRLTAPPPARRRPPASSAAHPPRRAARDTIHCDPGQPAVRDLDSPVRRRRHLRPWEVSGLDPARAEELGFHSGWTGAKCWAPCPTWARLRRSVTPRHAPSWVRLGWRSLSLPCTARCTWPRPSARWTTQPGPDRGGRRHRGPVPHVPGVRPARPALRGRVHRGTGADAGDVDQDRVDFDGRFWQTQGAAMEPEPFQKPYPPIWFEAVTRTRCPGGAAGRRVHGRRLHHHRRLRGAGPPRPGGARRGGPGSASFRVAKRVYLGVDDDARRAQQRTGDAVNTCTGTSG